MEWINLVIAGLFEITWAIGLKYTDGMSKMIPSILTVIAMIASFFFLAQALKTIPDGICRMDRDWRCRNRNIGHRAFFGIDRFTAPVIFGSDRSGHHWAETDIAMTIGNHVGFARDAKMRNITLTSILCLQRDCVVIYCPAGRRSERM